ncbi:MAG TPA: tellurite resistance/C4-dicarboxylate transporter family protein [Streptosporangiaceae bacterium]|nr:tellurite resistance/C4-dicarboxylate transporter family protein [Streptosporangiaceae bacterium]
MRRGAPRGVLAQAAARAEPAHFAVVMATGILSAALRRAGFAAASGALLALALGAFLVLLAAVGGRAVHDRPGLLAGLSDPVRAPGWFCFVAACGVLGTGLMGVRPAALALAALVLAGWLVLAGLIPARLARAPRFRPGTVVNGSWYLGVVATQSVALAVASRPVAGLLGAPTAATAAGPVWAAGLLLYLVITALLLARLHRAGAGPVGTRAPYWVAMGAASISVLAATRIIALPGDPGIRPAVTGLAIMAWALATLLIPVLATATVRDCWPRGWRPRYRAAAWTVLFPAGMYAMAGLELGRAARMPAIVQVGAAVLWPVAAGWALTVAAMATALRDALRRAGRAGPGYGPPAAGHTSSNEDSGRRSASRLPPGTAPAAYIVLRYKWSPAEPGFPVAPDAGKPGGQSGRAP